MVIHRLLNLSLIIQARIASQSLLDLKSSLNYPSQSYFLIRPWNYQLSIIRPDFKNSNLKIYRRNCLFFFLCQFWINQFFCWLFSFFNELAIYLTSKLFDLLIKQAFVHFLLLNVWQVKFHWNTGFIWIKISKKHFHYRLHFQGIWLEYQLSKLKLFNHFQLFSRLKDC